MINSKTIVAAIFTFILTLGAAAPGQSNGHALSPGGTESFDPPASETSPDQDSGDRNEDQPSRMPLMINERVEQEIFFFTTTGRDLFQRWLTRSAKYLPIVKKILREKELPDDLACLPLIESGFNVYAISGKKAVGPWQFMIKTARSYGLTSNWWIDERRDPIKSTRAAAAHLKDLYKIFGSWPLALASYNAGSPRMQKAIRDAGSSDFWDLQESDYIGDETRNYVPRYIAAMIITRNPAAYGFTVPETAPFAYQEILLPGSTNIGLVAGIIGSTLEELRELNPELKHIVTPPDSNGYFLRIPPGTKKKYLAAELKKTNRSWLEEWALKKKSLQTAFAPLQTELSNPTYSRKKGSVLFDMPFPLKNSRESDPHPRITLQASDVINRKNLASN